MSSPSVSLRPTSFTNFGELLKYLRLRARLTQRELAIAVDYDHAHISRLEHNHRLPDAATLLALFIPALRLEHEPEWAARLIELADKTRGESTPGGATPSPPALTPLPATRAAHYLPVPLTPLLGREAESDAVQEILLRPEVRLLTLIGPPGVGKTRLALHIAWQLAAAFPDGRDFVDLASVREPAQVLPAILQTLQIKESPAKSLDDSLLAELQDKQTLLILDNFEQILEAAPQLSRLLRQAPAVKMIVTSREALRISGEHEFPLAPLPLPDLETLSATTEALSKVVVTYAAVNLFVQRAQAVKPDFELTPANALTIAHICQKLDGLPLAIELAAARVRLFTPDQMLARLDHRLAWLTSGQRDGPAWRRTLSGAIDWSYYLLEPETQRLFRALAVFAGHFGLAAVEAVYGAPEIAFGEIIKLVDKSLVRLAPPQADDPLRFALLETLREYAQERLHENHTEQLSVWRAYAQHSAALVKVEETQLVGERRLKWMRHLDVEHEHLRAALGWLLEHDPEAGLRLVCQLFPYWKWRSYVSEGRHWLEAALARARGDLEHPWRGRLLQRLGETHRSLGALESAAELLAQSLTLARAGHPPDEVEVINNLVSLSYLEETRGNFSQAAQYATEGLQLAATHRYAMAQIYLMRVLGHVARDQGELPIAQAQYQAAVAVALAAKDPVEVAMSRNDLGNVEMDLREYQRARSHFRENLSFFETARDPMGHAITLTNLGIVSLLLEDFSNSKTYTLLAVKAWRKMGRNVPLTYALQNLAETWVALGKQEAARLTFQETLRLACEAQLTPRVMAALAGVATLYAAQGETPSAIRLCGLILNHPATEHETKVTVEALLARLRPTTSAEAVEAWLVEGRELDWEKVVDDFLME